MLLVLPQRKQGFALDGLVVRQQVFTAFRIRGLVVFRSRFGFVGLRCCHAFVFFGGGGKNGSFAEVKRRFLLFQFLWEAAWPNPYSFRVFLSSFSSFLHILLLLQVVLASLLHCGLCLAALGSIACAVPPLAGLAPSCAWSERTKAAPGKGPLLPHVLQSLKV